MNKLNTLTFITALAIALISCNPDQGLPSEVVQSIEKRVNNGINQSIAIALIDKNGVEYYNYGKTAADGERVDENTIFEIGSISKVFTAIMLAQQSLDGDLNFDDDVFQFLPDSLSSTNSNPNQITFGSLADHTSGLPRMPDNFEPANKDNPYADYYVENLFLYLKGYIGEKRVVSRYGYSNLGFGLLGHVLARNKDKTYDDLLKSTITTPLQLNSTMVWLSDSLKSQLAPGHNGKYVVANWDFQAFAGAGGIRSSSKDMARFIAANLGYIESPLSEAIKLSHTERHQKASHAKVALGWHIQEGKKGNIIYHSGATGGYITFAGFVKETGKGAIVLTNSFRNIEDLGMFLLDSNTSLTDIKTKEEGINLTASALEIHTGVYHMEPDIEIEITRTGAQLFMQSTDEEKFEIYPDGPNSFFMTAFDSHLNFKDYGQDSIELVFTEYGQETRAMKVRKQP